MVLKKGRDPVSSGLALRSFREQGFSTESAICEIIDNAVEADASEIRIKFNWKSKELGHKFKRVGKFVFTDNGVGMDEKTLFDCLVLGESTRRASLKGIGKFGVGATFSGISQGKQIQVFSKTNGGKWHWTQLDLDLLESGEGIPDPQHKNPPEEFTQNLKEHGTIVIWDKIDRSDFSENNVEKLKTEVGRIYRKFMTKEKLEDGKIVKNKNLVKITIEGVDVEPYDPLYLTYNPKQDDAEKPESKTRVIPLKKGNLKSEMVVTTSYFPESWWIEDQAGSKPENKSERKITAENQGVTVVREGREVLFGDIPYFRVNDASGTGTGFIDLDRWTGFEISFNRDADEIFGIQNNKSRLLMSTYASEEISKAISETLVQRRQTIQSKRGKKKEQSGASRPTSFEGSKPFIQEIIETPNYSDSQKQTLRSFVEKISNSKQELEEGYSDLIKGYHAVVSFDLDPTGAFVTYENIFDSILVKYNGNHPFMKKFFATLEEMAKKRGEKPENALNIEEIRSLKILFDMLLAALGISKKRFPDLSAKEEVESTINTLVTNWGDIAYRLSKQKFESE